MMKSKVIQLKKNLVHYKKPPSNFGAIEKIRLSLSREQYETRKKRRTKEFEKNRIISSPCSTTSQKDELRTKVADWKEKRMREKKAMKSNKKPPFIVGIVRHHVYSPISTSTMTFRRKKKSVTQEHKNSNVVKGITKATEKRLQAKMVKAEMKQKPPTTPTSTKSSTKLDNEIKVNKSFAPSDHKFNPPAGLSKISLFVKTPTESNSLKKNNAFAFDISMEAADKKSASHNFGSIESITLKLSPIKSKTSDLSQKMQTNLRLNNDEIIPLGLSAHKLSGSSEIFNTEVTRADTTNNSDVPLTIRADTTNNSNVSELFDTELTIRADTINNSDVSLTIRADTTNNSDVSQLFDTELIIRTDTTKKFEVKEMKYNLTYFKRLLDEEETRLQKLCEKWTEIQSQTDVEDSCYQINQAVGQTTILIKHKFKQFYKLILDCERKDSNVLVTCMDLHGLWDTMYLQVKDCHSRFAKLEELRAKCWQEDQSLFVKSTRIKKKTVTKKKIIPVNQNLKGIAQIQDNEKNSQEIINMNNECITPYINNNKRAVNVSGRSFNVPSSKISTNYMYTSTPFSVDTKSNVSNQLNTPLIAMKVSQSAKKLFSNKILETKSLERSSRHPSVNKIVKNSCGISKNNLLTPRNTSLFHVVRSINFNTTPNTDRITKGHNSNIKGSSR